MVVVLDRNKDTFSKDVTDELNKSFGAITEKINNYKSVPLEYKEEVQSLSPSSSSPSFRAGNLVCIRDSFVVEKDLPSFQKVGSIQASIPYDVWGKAITENNESLSLHIKGSDVYLYGNLTRYPQMAYLTEDVVLPQ